MTRPVLSNRPVWLVFCFSLACVVFSSDAAPDEQPPVSVAGFSLIESEPPREPFWEGSFPRTRALLDDARLRDVCCVGDKCWAVGERGVVLFSDDLGQSWTTRAVPFTCSLACVSFLTDRIGWIAGTRIDPVSGRSSAVLCTTRDGGMNWVDVLSSDAAQHAEPGSVAGNDLTAIFSLRFFGLREGLVLAAHGHDAGIDLLRTTDGGNNWVKVASDAEQSDWTAAAFLNAHEGIVVGNRLSFAAFVADKIVTLNQPRGLQQAVSDVSLSTDGQGWICGDGGFLLRSADSGISWSVVSNALDNSLRRSVDLHSVTHRNEVILSAGSPGSALLRSDDGGQSWSLQPLPGTLPITRVRFIADKTVLAVGSCGRVLRSVDSGSTWQTIRGADRRCGVLQLVSDHQSAVGGLLAATAGNDGVRTVVAQLSSLPASLPHTDSAAVLRTQQAVTGLGGDYFLRDWRFPQDAPEQFRTMDALLATWNRVTDGRLRDALPRRLACLIRTWRPSVIVLEPATQDDAVMQLIQAALPTALRIAAGEEPDSAAASEMLLPPHRVERLLIRAHGDQTTPLAFRKDDLLGNAGTTIELVTHAGRRLLNNSDASTLEIPDTEFYQNLEGNLTSITPTGVLHGLESRVGSDARRPTERFTGARLQDLEQIIQAARTESAALLGNAALHGANSSILAHVTRVGQKLPDNMALQQLRYLSNLNHKHQNFDGWVAVLREITRRFPESPDARVSAEQLFRYYSSREIRHVRVKAMQNLQADEASTQIRNAAVSGVEDLLRPERRPAIETTPEIEPARGVTFGSGSQQISELMGTWDRLAADALRLMTRRVPADEISADVILRQAANFREAGRTGDQATVLGFLAERGVPQSAYAQAEMQAQYAASTPAVPTINIMLTSQKPWLDAGLNDVCWEQAKEIRLAEAGVGDTSPYGDSLLFLSFDREYLYVAGRIEFATSGHAAVPLAIDRAHDATHGTHDRLELSIDTDRDYATHFTFCVDQTGQTSEACWQMQQWNPQWFAAVDKDSAVWRFELAIPLEELTSRPARPGDLWTMRVRRVCPGVLQQTISESDVDRTGEAETFLVRFIRGRR